MICGQNESVMDILIGRQKEQKIFNLFEKKFSIRPFFLSTFGLAKNEYSGMVQNDLTMDVLFGQLP